MVVLLDRHSLPFFPPTPYPLCSTWCRAVLVVWTIPEWLPIHAFLPQTPQIFHAFNMQSRAELISIFNEQFFADASFNRSQFVRDEQKAQVPKLPFDNSKTVELHNVFFCGFFFLLSNVCFFLQCNTLSVRLKSICGKSCISSTQKVDSLYAWAEHFSAAKHIWCWLVWAPSWNK